MGQDPDLIRKDIEDTRERMGETVDALGYKTDVKSRAKESVTGKVDSVKEKLVGAKDSAMESVTGAKDSVSGAKDSAMSATPSAGDVKSGAKQAVGIAQENPLGLAVGAIAVGFLAGMLVPSTRIENEKIGPMADQVKDQISSTAHEALEHGKAVVSETASSAVDAAKTTAQEQGQEHASQVKDSAQESAQDVRQSVKS
jgi:gas vesicle protein